MNALVPNRSDDSLRPVHAWAILLVIIAVWWWRVLASSWYSADPGFDAVRYYLPLARKFLLDPGALWFEPERIAVAPGSYLYFSLFGANPHRALQGNLWLATFTIILLFDGVRRLGSWWAGVAAAAFYATSPVLLPVVIPLQTEPPYMFFIALWLWASIRVLTQPTGWVLLVLGALAMSAATLTRATHLYWVPAAAIGGGLGWWWLRHVGDAQVQRYFLRFSLMHLLALAPLLAYVALNAHTHNTHKFVTGSGAALYFGMNAATGGEEPPYFGLLHAERSAYHGFQEHLTLDADAQLTAVAKAIALDMPALNFVQLLQHKVAANLFFSNTHLKSRFAQRLYRIVLVFLAFWALLRRYRQPFLLMIAGLLCYHLSILSLLMYNQRYSVGGLELPLLVLAAVGVSDFFEPQMNRRVRWCGLSILLLALLIGAWQLRSAPPPMPDLSKVPHMDLGILDTGAAKVSGAAGSVFGAGALALADGVRLRWDNVRYTSIAVTPVLRIPVIEGSPSCRSLHMTYETSGAGARTHTVSLKRLKSPVELQLGTLALNSLSPQEGALTLHFECPEGTRLRLGNLKMQGITLGYYYRDQVSRQNALTRSRGNPD
jgi:hypothetical protein